MSQKSNIICHRGDKMRKVELRMNEQEKYEVIKNLVEKKGNKERASKKLGISRRQVDRLIIAYKQKGKEAFVHGNRNRKPAIAKEQNLSNEIVLLYQNKYNSTNEEIDAFNFKHFHEKLKEEEGIDVSYTYVYKTLRKENILSPKVQKLTKKKIRMQELRAKKENKNKTEKELEEIANHSIGLEDAHPRRERKKYFGEEIQMDASVYVWFGNEKYHLHLSIDDATGIIVGGYFDKQETLKGYYNVFFQILTNYGIPYSFLTDNRTVFNYLSSNDKSAEKDVLTQFGYACKQLGVDLHTTSVSQAKGRIERLNETVQGRLPQELRMKGITTVEEANKFLVETFIPDFNKRFALPSNTFQSVFEEAPSLDVINYTLAVLTSRKLDNGNAIKFKGNYYQPYLNGELACFLPKTECLVINAFDGTLLVTIDDKVCELKKLESNVKTSTEIDVLENEEVSKKTKKKYIPPMSHPWKNASFKKYYERAHYQHAYA